MSLEIGYEIAIRDLSHLSGNFFYCQFNLTSIILSHSGASGFPAGGEDFQSHVAARLGPFVILLGQDRADQADDGVAAHQPGRRTVSRSLADTAPRRSGRTAVRIAQIPKLIVR